MAYKQRVLARQRYLHRIRLTQVNVMPHDKRTMFLFAAFQYAGLLRVIDEPSLWSGQRGA
jgi:hypothetical protein